MGKQSVHESKRAGLGAAGWLTVAALGMVLGAAIWFLFWGWNLTDAQISTQGYIALALGILLSVLLGGGLMTLLFWSNRKGYDR